MLKQKAGACLRDKPQAAGLRMALIFEDVGLLRGYVLNNWSGAGWHHISRTLDAVGYIQIKFIIQL